MKFFLLVVCILGFILATNASPIVLDHRTFERSVVQDYRGISPIKTKVTFNENSTYPNQVFECRRGWEYGVSLIVCDIPYDTKGWQYNSYDEIVLIYPLATLLFIVHVLFDIVLHILLLFSIIISWILSPVVLGSLCICGFVVGALGLIYYLGLHPFVLKVQEMISIIRNLHIPSNLLKEVLKFLIQNSIGKRLVPEVFQFLLKHSSPETPHWNSSKTLLTYAIQAERYDLTQTLLDLGCVPTFYDLQLAVTHDDIGTASKLIHILKLSEIELHPFTFIVTEQMQNAFPSTLRKGYCDLGFFVTNKQQEEKKEEKKKDHDISSSEILSDD